MRWQSLFLAGLIALDGCTTKLYLYQPPTAEVEYQGPTARRLPRKELLKKTLDDIALSGMFDSLMIDDLWYQMFELRIQHSKVSGMYDTPKIIFFIGPGGYYQAMLSEEKYRQLQWSLLSTAGHELGHKFWKRKLNDMQRAKFSSRMHQYYQAYKEIDRITAGKSISASLCAPYGLTVETYHSLKNWIETEPFYREWYPKDRFDEFFFGTEAFAHLIDSQTSPLLRHIPLVERPKHFQPLPPNIWELTNIPPDLRSYYHRFFHENFFDAVKLP